MYIIESCWITLTLTGNMSSHPFIPFVSVCTYRLGMIDLFHKKGRKHVSLWSPHLPCEFGNPWMLRCRDLLGSQLQSLVASRTLWTCVVDLCQAAEKKKEKWNHWNRSARTAVKSRAVSDRWKLKIISKFCFQVTVGANCVTCNLGLLQFLRQRLEAEGRGLANCLAPLGKNGCSIMFDHIDLGCQTGTLKGIWSCWTGYNFATGRVVVFGQFFCSATSGSRAMFEAQSFSTAQALWPPYRSQHTIRHTSWLTLYELGSSSRTHPNMQKGFRGKSVHHGSRVQIFRLWTVVLWYASRQLADNVLFCSCGSGWCGWVSAFRVILDLDGI